MFTRRSRIPSLQEMIAFEAAGRLGSFSAAAEMLALTQSAVSRQISGLEDTVGIALFDRRHRRVTLTDAGRVYLAEVRRTLAQLAEATDRVATFGAADVINLATLPTFAIRWLIPRLPGFLALAPDVTVNVLSRTEPFDFGTEPFDAAIHFGSDDWSGATGLRLCDETAIAVLGVSLAARVGGHRDLRSVTRLYQTSRLDAWDDWFAAQGQPPVGRTGPRFDQFGMLAAATIAGLGAAVMPRFLIEDELASGRLIAVSGAAIVNRGSYWLMRPKGRAESRALSGFADWILREAGKSNFG